MRLGDLGTREMGMKSYSSSSFFFMNAVFSTFFSFFLGRREGRDTSTLIYPLE